MEINDRIRKLRKTLNLTQKEFGERIGLKSNSIALIEGGRNTSDQTIFAICREFGVNEQWLRTGEGEMFLPNDRGDALAAAVNAMLAGESSDFKRRLVKVLVDLSPREWEILEQRLIQIAGEGPGEKETPLTIEEEARMEAEKYYKQILLEKKAKAGLSTSPDIKKQA